MNMMKYKLLSLLVERIQIRNAAKYKGPNLQTGVSNSFKSFSPIVSCLMNEICNFETKFSSQERF
jgi:hypothetical protein